MQGQLGAQSTLYHQLKENPILAKLRLMMGRTDGQSPIRLCDGREGRHAENTQLWRKLLAENGTHLRPVAIWPCDDRGGRHSDRRLRLQKRFLGEKEKSFWDRKPKVGASTDRHPRGMRQGKHRCSNLDRQTAHPLPHSGIQIRQSGSMSWQDRARATRKLYQ